MGSRKFRRDSPFYRLIEPKYWTEWVNDRETNPFQWIGEVEGGDVLSTLLRMERPSNPPYLFYIYFTGRVPDRMSSTSGSLLVIIETPVLRTAEVLL